MQINAIQLKSIKIQIKNKLQQSLILYKLKSVNNMSNRLNKPKKSSKLKHTMNNQKFSYNSPLKYITHTIASSGCCPKPPPNISYYHLSKKNHQVKEEYYIGGKQNKGRMMNNYMEPAKQFSKLESTDRLREKRNTHNNILNSGEVNRLLQVRKSNNQNQNLIKTIQKTKEHFKPISLGPMRNQKNRLLKHTDKDHKLTTKYLQKSFKNKEKSNFIAEQKEETLFCFENLISNSIAQSKVSSIHCNDVTNFQEQSQNIIVEKQRLNPSKKTYFHRSPKILSPTAAFKRPQKTNQELIAEFESKISQINTNAQHDSLKYMSNKDSEYIHSKNLNCYLSNQLSFDWKKRAIVINWMTEVIAQPVVSGKRQTLANAANIFDRYLSSTLNISLDRVQCTASACLLIASKLQDKFLDAEYLSSSTAYKYSVQEIVDQQYKIFQQLEFKVNTPTLNNWCNRLAAQWDMYLDNMQLRNYDIILSNISIIKFKANGQNIHSYYNYRWLCQYADFTIMDIYTLRYQPKMLALAFIYLVLLLRLKIYTQKQVAGSFPYTSQFLLEKSTFNQFFSEFLRDSFTLNLFDLLPMIQYCSTFVILPLQFSMPTAFSEENQEVIHYQNFCTIQTFNPKTLSALYQRDRNIF